MILNDYKNFKNIFLWTGEIIDVNFTDSRVVKL